MKVLYLLFLCTFFGHAQNLLVEDPFYEEKLPELLGENFSPKGTYRVVHSQPLYSLHPFSNDPFVSRLWELCSGTLSQKQFGKSQTMSPYFAKSIEKKKTEARVDYYVELRPDLFWQPLDLTRMENGISYGKEPVTSWDFKYYVDQFKNPNIHLPLAESLRKSYQHLEGIEVQDDSHFVVRWVGEEEIDWDFMTGDLKPLPRHIFSKDFTGEEVDERGFENHPASYQIVSCGPWRVSKLDLSDKKIELERNEHFFDPKRALFKKMLFTYKSTSSGAWQAFKRGEIDSYYLLPSQQSDYEQFLSSKLYERQKEAKEGIESVEFLSKIYYFIGWNGRNSLFQDPKVRVALTHAINREQILDHFIGGRGALLTGPLMPDTMAYDKDIKPYSYDLSKAKELLEESGYSQSEGYYQKGGKRFSFKLLYYGPNDLHGGICQYISSSLKKLGVECEIVGLGETFWKHYHERDFDAICLGWTLPEPPEDLEGIWSSSGALNLIGFKDPEVDAWIGALKTEKDPSSRRELYHQIHSKIHELAPYTFLYVPKQTFLYRQKVGNVFIPSDRPDLIADADLSEPSLKIYYMRDEKSNP